MKVILDKGKRENREQKNWCQITTQDMSLQKDSIRYL